MADLSPLSLFNACLKVKGKSWRALISAVTILAFIALVCASVNHIHQSSQESQECSICSVVTDKVGSSFTSPALIVAQFILLFAIAAITLRSSLHVCARLLPRSCGPPASL